MISKSELKEKLRKSAIGMVIGGNIVFIYIFYRTFFSHNQKLIITINDYGEAIIEAYLVFPLLILSCLYLIYEIWIE